jgi:hypothetical protein
MKSLGAITLDAEFPEDNPVLSTAIYKGALFVVTKKGLHVLVNGVLEPVLIKPMSKENSNAKDLN